MRAKIPSLVAIAGLAFCTNTSPASAQMAESPIGILLAAGDISRCGDEERHGYADRTAALIRKIVKKYKSAQPPVPVRVLALGDLAYDRGTTPELTCFARRWSGFDDILRPVPGNHEYLSPDAKPYFEHFKNNPFVHQQKDNPKGYFVENFPRKDGPWRLIGLNAHLPGADDRIKQLKWLETALGKSNTTPCVLAFWHTPTFTSGRHGHKPYWPTRPDLPLTKKRPMQKALRILYRHGASVVLAGHDHNYEQFSRHDAEGNAAKDGIRSFVVGTGGAPLTQDFYSELAPNSEGLYGRDKLGNGKQGLLKIVLYERRYEWDFLSIDGTAKLPLKTRKDDCMERRAP